MHGNLRTLVGAADYALFVKDPVLFSRVDALYRYVRSEGTRFGFLPEVIGRKGDIVSCETCALMDFIGLAVSLANNGHPEYWGDVERMVRNQLVESQVRDVSWLTPGNQSDTEQCTWRDVERAWWAAIQDGRRRRTFWPHAKNYIGVARSSRENPSHPELLRRIGHARVLHCLEECGTLRRPHTLCQHAH